MSGVIARASDKDPPILLQVETQASASRISLIPGNQSEEHCFPASKDIYSTDSKADPLTWWTNFHVYCCLPLSYLLPLSAHPSPLLTVSSTQHSYGHLDCTCTCIHGLGHLQFSLCFGTFLQKVRSDAKLPHDQGWVREGCRIPNCQ